MAPPLKAFANEKLQSEIYALEKDARNKNPPFMPTETLKNKNSKLSKKMMNQRKVFLRFEMLNKT
jgi:hypothetical protein